MDMLERKEEKNDFDNNDLRPSAPIAPTDEIYFEKQDMECSLCGQHAINNLLQGPYITAMDLGQIGSDLDRQETALLESGIMEESDDNDDYVDDFDDDDDDDDDGMMVYRPPRISQSSNRKPKPNQSKRYSNVSLDGNFSIDVLKCALNKFGLYILPLSHPEAAEATTTPEREMGFILYSLSHWIALRKVNAHWYNLNSLSGKADIPAQPTRLSEFYLSAQMSQLADEGFQAFVVRNNNDEWPQLGRNAPCADQLKGGFLYYNSNDILSQSDLKKYAANMREQKRLERTVHNRNSWSGGRNYRDRTQAPYQPTYNNVDFRNNPFEFGGFGNDPNIAPTTVPNDRYVADAAAQHRPPPNDNDNGDNRNRGRNDNDNNGDKNGGGIWGKLKKGVSDFFTNPMGDEDYYRQYYAEQQQHRRQVNDKFQRNVALAREKEEKEEMDTALAISASVATAEREMNQCSDEIKTQSDDYYQAAVTEAHSNGIVGVDGYRENKDGNGAVQMSYEDQLHFVMRESQIHK